MTKWPTQMNQNMDTSWVGIQYRRLYGHLPIHWFWKDWTNAYLSTPTPRQEISIISLKFWGTDKRSSVNFNIKTKAHLEICKQQAFLGRFDTRQSAKPVLVAFTADSCEEAVSHWWKWCKINQTNKQTQTLQGRRTHSQCIGSFIVMVASYPTMHRQHHCGCQLH